MHRVNESGVLPSVMNATGAVSHQLQEHYEDLKQAAFALNPAACTSDEATHCVMVVIYLLHEYDLDAAPLPQACVAGLFEIVALVVSDSTSRFWIAAAILGTLWHSCSLGDVLQFVARHMAGGRAAAVWERLDDSVITGLNGLVEQCVPGAMPLCLLL
jgi:hypothetical protein